MKVCLHCDQPFSSSGWRCPACGHAPRENEVVVFTDDAEKSGEAFDAETFADLARLEDRSFWFRSRNRLIAWAIARYFPGAKSFLEVGCGTGFVLQGLRRTLPGMSFAGGELGTAGLRVARDRLPGVPLFAFDAKHVPFEDEFDVVGAFDILEHVDDDAAVLAQLYRAVRPRGGVIITVPQHQWLWSAADAYAGHRRRYSADHLLSKLTHAGFHVVRRTSFVTLLLPVMAVSRLLQRRADRYDPLAEYRSSKSVDRLLDGLQAIEHAFITRGISFPVGGSLLFAARKES